MTIKEAKLTIKEQIRGLEIIMQDGIARGDRQVFREYVIEKLRKIRKEINFLDSSIINVVLAEREND